MKTGQAGSVRVDVSGADFGLYFVCFCCFVCLFVCVYVMFIGYLYWEEEEERGREGGRGDWVGGERGRGAWDLYVELIVSAAWCECMCGCVGW